jgi:ATPase subunit of ABC transporter with duplicated ATPase domains
MPDVVDDGAPAPQPARARIHPGLAVQRKRRKLAASPIKSIPPTRRYPPCNTHRCGRYALEAASLTKTFGGTTPALRDVSFAVPAGTVCGPLVPNGADNTTTINIPSTLMRSTRPPDERSQRIGRNPRRAPGRHPRRLTAKPAGRVLLFLSRYGDDHDSTDEHQRHRSGFRTRIHVEDERLG